MKHIGGFFELELKRGKSNYHDQAFALSTGRACIHLLLKKLKPSKVFVPFYTCDATYEPFHLCGIPMEYYALDEKLFPKELPDLKVGEYFFYTNYFGLKEREIELLLEKYGKRLIIDDTHAFFKKGYPSNWSFTSARKYFGVPDGAYLYSPEMLKEEWPRFEEISIAHNVDRFIGNQEKAFAEYVAYEKTLNSDIMRISLYSELVLSHIDYKEVSERRRSNFQFLHNELKDLNTLNGLELKSEIPFCYPFLPAIPIARNLFFPHRIYIASYWMDTINRKMDGYDFEKSLSLNMLPLTIDHRYDSTDLKRIVDLIKKQMHGK